MQKIYPYLGLVSDPSIAVACYENNVPNNVLEILKAFWQSTIGDPNLIFLAGKFDASRAHTWKNHMDKWDSLKPEIRAFVEELGFEVLI